MRQTNRRKQQAWAKVAIIFAALLLASCSMMKEDRNDCPDCRNPLHIKVRYDYNIQRANMFADHVKQATVYVVDPATSTVVDMQTALLICLGSEYTGKFSFLVLQKQPLTEQDVIVE